MIGQLSLKSGIPSASKSNGVSPTQLQLASMTSLKVSELPSSQAWPGNVAIDGSDGAQSTSSSTPSPSISIVMVMVSMPIPDSDLLTTILFTEKLKQAPVISSTFSPTANPIISLS